MNAAWWPYALAAVLLLALGIVVLLVMLLKKAAKATQFVDAEEPPEAEAEPKKAKPARGEGGEVVGIGAAFRRAAQHLRDSRDGQFDAVPLFLLAGAELSRDPDLLGSARVDLPFGSPDEAEMSLGEGRGFWFFDTGVILDVAGAQILRADGRTSDERGWSSLISHIRKLRPKRPIDGAIITVPASDLLDADSNEKARADFASRMTRVQRKLIDAQRQLGFRVPCYVVITGCERLSGFASLCAALPSASREQMLGWSSPYSIDSAYRSTWADEAIAACAERLDEVQLEAFADGTLYPAALLHFPDTVRGLAAPLRACLDQLFRSSAYHGALIMRGVYLSGREEDQSEAHAFAPKAAGETAFLRELIEQKVFAERALARPTAGMITQRHRAVRMVQVATAAAALLFGFGLWHAYYRMRHQNDVVAPFLRYSARMTEETRKIAMASTATASTGETRLDVPARDILDALAKIDFQHYGSWFIPDTWFSPLRGRIDDSIENAFRDVILEGLRSDLKEEARRITGTAGAYEIVETAPVRVPLTTQSTLTVPTLSQAEVQPQAEQVLLAEAARGAEAPIVPIEEMQQFRNLQDYVQKVVAFEETVGTFNRLVGPEAGNLKDLGIVVKHSFDKDLPSQFYSESRLYEKALQKATAAPFDLSPHRASAALRAQQLARELYGALYGGNAFARRLQQLSLRLHQASTQWPSPLDAAAFAELVQRQRDIETQLSRPELEWAFRRDFDLGPAFNTVVAQMERSQLLGVGVVASIRGEGQEGLWQFQRGLASTTSPLTGPILAMDRDARPLMQLSPDTLLLKSAVESFIGEGFVGTQSQGRRIAARVPEGKRLVWDGRLLEQAAGVSQAYDRFRSKTLDVFPAELRGSIDSVARERAQARMTDLVANAQQYAPIVPAGSDTSVEEQLRWDVGSFTATMQPVLDNLDAFARQGSAQPRRDLADATTVEATRLLRAVDHLLQIDAPYQPRQGGFAWWDGFTPPSPAAWAGPDADVNAYLDITRSRLTVLARSYAQPLLTWFTKAGTRDEPDVRNLAAKWQGILDDLRDYDAKKPGNSLALLEEYIASQMPKVGATNCKAAAAPQLRSRTFFAASLSGISSELTGRCYEVAGSSANTQYSELARYFNDNLRGHYPFADSLPGPKDREADPKDIREFFGRFDKTQPLVKAMPGDAAPWVPSAQKFVADMARVRGFFAPFLDAEKPVAVPSFDVETVFRVLAPEREVKGDQIIAWTLQVGDQVVTNRDKAKKVRWTYGDPLQLSLRWAAQSPCVPVQPEGQRGVSVNDRTVTYDYSNKWSLVSALVERRAGAELLPDYADLQPVTLYLSIPTQPAGEDATPCEPVADPTRVFLRVTPLAPGTNQPLEPPRFPTRAPRTGEAVAPTSFDAFFDPKKEAV